MPSGSEGEYRPYRRIVQPMHTAADLTALRKRLGLISTP